MDAENNAGERNALELINNDMKETTGLEIPGDLTLARSFPPHGLNLDPSRPQSSKPFANSYET